MELSPSTQSLIADMQAWHDANRDHIEIADESLFEALVCTDLADEDVDARMAQRPGSRSGWQRQATGAACQDRPETHRHLIYEA